jgi:ABC-type multidrug transport system fused ATPase/permease subunit
MLADQYFQTMRRSLWIRAFMVSSLEWIGFVFFAGLLFLVGQRLVLAFDGETLIQLMVALGLLMRPVKELGEQIARYHETKGILKSSLDVFHQVETLAALGKATVREARLREGSNSELLVAQMRVTVDQKLLFATENLSVARGQTIAVIGPSGAGKSTFIKSLAGLIAPSTWDATVEWQEFVSQVSFVSQDPFFFHDSIRSNLTYGIGGEGGLTDQDLWQALAEVGLEAEVRDFDQQLDTAVYAFTHNVSGGQLQRLVIARALLRNRRFLLLDEATSAIDAVAEGVLIKKLIEKSKVHKVNLIMITHRLQWLDHFDKVLFVEFGRITHSGPHARLLKLPRYQQYCQAETDAYTHQ